MFKYDLSDVFTVGKFEPFIGIGPGYTWFESQKYLQDLSAGVNYWFVMFWNLFNGRFQAI